MTLIEPVSSLSIRRAVNLYTIILFLSFGALLYWLATDRYQAFIESHENTADTTSKVVAFQIGKILNEKRREIDIFTEDHIDLVTELSNDPTNNSIDQRLRSRLKKYQPDFIDFNIMSTTGRTIHGNLSSGDNKSCLRDLKYFLKNDAQKVRLHPDNDGYHYDIISRLSDDKTGPVFLVRFSVDEITELLNSTQSQKHNLVLVNKEVNNAVGVTAKGDVKNIVGGLNFKIRNGVNLSMIAKTKVKDTNWYVVDMSDSELFSDYRNKIMKEYSIAFYIFAMIIIFMRYILLKQDAKRSAAEEQMQRNHEQITILNNSLEQLSKLDSLTGLYNRRYFDEMIKHEWNRALRSEEPISCALMDIDHFKNYNDHYGHQVGDKCLQDISSLLKDSFRRAGDIVARYGGEEFIIAMAGCTEGEAKVAIIKFQLALKKLKIAHSASETNKIVTVSAGLVTLTPSKNDSVESFIRNADTALYQAKENGRNQFVLHENKEHGSWDERM